jgi:hypothetical protein
VIYRLTAEQSQCWDEDPWSSWRTEEEVIEDLEARNITEEVIVLLDTGAVAFAVYKETR